MKAALTRRSRQPFWYYINGEKVNGASLNVWGDLTGIRGNFTGVRGNLTGISGDLTGIRGNLDDCNITEEDRKTGISIEDLVECQHPGDGEGDEG